MFIKKLLFLTTREGREVMRLKHARQAPVWLETVPATFGRKYKLVCWPILQEEDRTAHVLRALSRMTVESFDLERMIAWTGLDSRHAKVMFERLLRHGWIEPAD